MEIYDRLDRNKMEKVPSLVRESHKSVRLSDTGDGDGKRSGEPPALSSLVEKRDCSSSNAPR